MKNRRGNRMTYQERIRNLREDGDFSQKQIADI